jgi:adenylosuccinate lyase
LLKKEPGVRFDLFSPSDFRYNVEALSPFLSEEAYIRYKARVEAALASQLAKEGICTEKVAREIKKACSAINANEVYAEEKRIKHDIRALANVIRDRVSSKAKPFVHLSATSYDIVDTANSLRFKEAIEFVVLPDLVRLENSLIKISLKHANSVQVGRTHGQHAEPITFGFFLSYYVSRLGQRILKLKEATSELVGKFAGAVGVYGPISLLIDNPEGFERELLASLGLHPSEVSTQIVQPEPITDLIHVIVSTMGVLANFARDMRHLQRTEIDEVAEGFSSNQVGSSTMPQKRNPISFENVESLWKKFMPQMVTVYLDQVSEHQRDLTNSSSQRYLPELIMMFDYCVRRLTSTIWDAHADVPRLSIDESKMRRNMQMSLDQMAAEPLYVLLASAGHDDAHEFVRKNVQRSIELRKPFRKTIFEDSEFKKYRSIIGDRIKYVENPEIYIGLAAEKTIKVAKSWHAVMKKSFTE